MAHVREALAGAAPESRMAAVARSGYSSDLRIASSPASTATKLTVLMANAQPAPPGGDHETRERRAEYARRVEQARVERDRVRQLGGARPAGSVSDLARRARRSTSAEPREARRSRRPCHGTATPPSSVIAASAADEHHLHRLRAEDHAATVVEPVDDRRLRTGRSTVNGPNCGRSRARRPRVRAECGASETISQRAGDVLHPRAGDRDHLAAEEEAVVRVAAGGLRRCAGSAGRAPRSHRFSRSRRPSGSIAASTAASSAGERPSSRSASQRVRSERIRRSIFTPSGTESEADATAVPGRAARADHVAHSLEPAQVRGHARGGHPLELRELTYADARPVVDRREEACLAAGDPERRDFPPQLPAHREQDGRAPVGDLGRVGALHNVVTH